MADVKKRDNDWGLVVKMRRQDFCPIKGGSTMSTNGIDQFF
jgi:hypothetical protein